VRYARVWRCRGCCGWGVLVRRSAGYGRYAAQGVSLPGTCRCVRPGATHRSARHLRLAGLMPVRARGLPVPALPGECGLSPPPPNPIAAGSFGPGGFCQTGFVSQVPSGPYNPPAGLGRPRTFRLCCGGPQLQVSVLPAPGRPPAQRAPRFRPWGARSYTCVRHARPVGVGSRAGCATLAA
jgi:hypothetical protein